MKVIICILSLIPLISCQTTKTKKFSTYLEQYGNYQKKPIIIDNGIEVEGTIDFSNISEKEYFSFIKDYYFMHNFMIEESKEKITVKDISQLKKKWHTQFKKAIEVSQTSQKNILVKYEADWCAPCKMQTIQFLQNESLPLYEQYVLVKFDLSKNEDLIKEMELANLNLPRIDIFAVGQFKNPILTLTGYSSNQSIPKQLELAATKKK